jgi:hypothetical protein
MTPKKETAGMLKHPAADYQSSQNHYDPASQKAQASSLFLGAAQGYAERGKAVFPVQPRGKTPLTPHGCKDATVDPIVIARWWKKWPNANIGLTTGSGSGIFVLDIDGEEGEESVRTLERKHGPLPLTAEAITGGGGRHLFFLWPQGGTISNSAGRLGTGLDVRGNAGYVVAPPSIHPSGKGYTWSVDSADQAVQAPVWLLALISSPQDVGRLTPVSEWRDLVKGVPEGQRNHALARLAGKLLRCRLDPYMVLDLCLAWNETRCRPPLSQEEVAQTVNSIAGRELARRGG